MLLFTIICTDAASHISTKKQLMQAPNTNPGATKTPLSKSEKCRISLPVIDSPLMSSTRKKSSHLTFFFYNIYSLLKVFFLQTFIHSVILQHFNLQQRTFWIKMSESGPTLKNAHDFLNLDQTWFPLPDIRRGKMNSELNSLKLANKL